MCIRDRNQGDVRRAPFILADIRRCRRNITYEGPERGWPAVCAADVFEETTRENWHEMDFIWVRGRQKKTRQGYLRALPWQGERWYHVCAVSFLLRSGWSFCDLGMGLRASGRLPQACFRDVLDKIEACQDVDQDVNCLLYTSPSPRDATLSRMPSSA